MLNLYSKKLSFTNRIVTGLVMCVLIFSALPSAAFADDATSTPPTTDVSGCTDDTALNFDAEATVDDASCEYPAPDVLGCMDDTASNYNSEATIDDDSCEYEVIDDPTATSTEEADDGEEGEDGETASSTDDTTATSTENGDAGDDTESGGDGEDGGFDGDGEDGTDGGNASSTNPCGEDVPDCGEDAEGGENNAEDGEEGSDGENGEDAVSDPIPVISDELIGDDDPSEEEEVTGGLGMSGSNALIETGPATARGDVFTDANSTNLKSELETYVTDLDTYMFNATGSNEAIVTNSGVILSDTGQNEAAARNLASIETGKAISTFNIANVINSNIINSDGYIYLANQIMDENTSLDLTSFFFPDEDEVFGIANECTLLSCAAEDIVYNFSQTNKATITNNAVIEAVTGENLTEPIVGTSGGYGEINTGDAYGSANVINVVNTNIVDSNYRLLTFNAIGDLEGDLVMPTQELFNAFFGRPNGMTQLEDAEDAHLTVENVNNALADNNLNTYAESGLNESTTLTDAAIKTGNSESESNVLNKINQNTFGGDSMYMLIRVHGQWSGEVVGLPAGLVWEWTPDGIIIYNEDAEIAPSEFFDYDVDSYTANLTNHNDTYIENNLDITAITGMNSVEGIAGTINTGDAYASANVMNIANTNVIGTNWTMAVVNILGDFDGNIAFSQTDLSVIGSFQQDNDPLAPGDTITFSFTVTNNGDNTATDVTLEQLLQNAHANSTATEQIVSLGDLAPGESVEVELEATVNNNLPYGSSTIRSMVVARSDQADTDESDNSVVDELTAYLENPNGNTDTGTTTDNGTTTDDGTGTTTDDGTSTSTDDGNGTTTDDGSDGGDNSENDDQQTTSSSGSSGGGGGGGGGGRSTKTKSIDRVQEGEIDWGSIPKLTVRKEASADEDDIVKAGQTVDYVITVLNGGADAHDAVIYDTLRNPIGSVVDEQSWELGTILSGEVIELTYSTEYNANTPSGTYTNTASIEAYGSETSKANGRKPLEVDDAVHTIEIDGKDVGIGNVEVYTFARLSPTNYAAIITWETTRPTDGQIFYEPKGDVSPYDPKQPNYGYQFAGMRLPALVTKHFTLLFNLTPGEVYTYRIRSVNGQYEAIGGDYTLIVPGGTNQTAPQPQVAGVQKTTPTPAPAAATYTTPAPKPEPVPEPEPEPEPTSEPDPQTSSSSGIGGFVKSAAKKVFGLF